MRRLHWRRPSNSTVSSSQACPAVVGTSTSRLASTSNWRGRPLRPGMSSTATESPPASMRQYSAEAAEKEKAGTETAMPPTVPVVPAFGPWRPGAPDQPASGSDMPCHRPRMPDVQAQAQRGHVVAVAAQDLLGQRQKLLL